MTVRNSPLLRLVIPAYDEITLFAMGLTCGLLLITGAVSSHWKTAGSASIGEDIKVILVLSLFLAGLVLSIYHAFTDRRKTYFEKTLMLLFAVILNGFSGIIAGTYLLEGARGWLMIFPILNIVNGALLIVLLRSSFINDRNISDENAPLSQVAVTGALVFVLFTVCRYAFDLLWIQTLSICVVYSTNVNRGMSSLFLKVVRKYGIPR